MTDDLTKLGTTGFEQLCQALALCVLGPGVEIFGAGPDGGREATFQGRVRYPSVDEPWDGYGVIQAKFKQTSGTAADASWFLARVKAEMDAWTDPARRRVRDGRLPDYLIFTTNIALSSVPGTGGKDRFNTMMDGYLPSLPLKGWRVWDGNQISSLLNVYPEVRRAFSALITPNELIASLTDRLAAPITVEVHQSASRIRPGQPGNETPFQQAYEASGASRLGEALGEVISIGDGLVQYFDGGRSGTPAVMCAPVGHPVVAMTQAVWDQLSAIGGRSGGVTGIGYPIKDADTSSYIGPDWETVQLVGGQWGRPADEVRRGQLVRGSGGRPLWQTRIVFDNEASRHQDWRVDHSLKMDLRLAVCGTIPLLADSLRINGLGRSRMLVSVADAGLNDLLNRLGLRYDIDSLSSGWQEVDDSYANNSRSATYNCVIEANERPAIWSGLQIALPAGHAGEVRVMMELRLDFDAIRPSPAEAAEVRIPADLALSLPEAIEFLRLGWHITTNVLLLAATPDPLLVQPAGAPRLELYIQNERPEHTGETRTLRLTDMVDLSAFGRARRQQFRYLGLGVTTPVGLTQPQISDHVQVAVARIAEDYGFAGQP